MKDFEHYLASMGNECNCLVIWTFFATALHWEWNEDWHFPVLWPLLSLSNLLVCWVQCLNSIIFYNFKSVQFNSVAQSCPILCNPMDRSISGLPVHHQLPEITQTHVHWVSEANQPSHPLSTPSPPTFNLSQHQGVFKWVSSSHQVAKVLEFQLQHQFFQWIFRTNFL